MEEFLVAEKPKCEATGTKVLRELELELTCSDAASARTSIM